MTPEQAREPCPFCGSAATHTSSNGVGSIFIECAECGSCGCSSDTVAGAADAWDTRASLAQPASVPAAQPPAEAHGDLTDELVEQAIEAWFTYESGGQDNHPARMRNALRVALGAHVQPKGPGDLKLNDPAVQKRLAAQWGYVQAPAPAPAPKAPASVIAFMAVNREGEARFTDNPDAARELEGYGWAITPLAQAPAVAHRDYLTGHADGLAWAADLVAMDDPRTGDWLYDDRSDLAKAIRKGPEMPDQISPDDLDEERRDAARYRWLREENQRVPGPCAYAPWGGPPMFGDDLDAAIDLAMHGKAG